MGTLELFIDPLCFCKGKAEGFIKKILKEFPDISFKEVDMSKEPGRAQEIGVVMSPTLALNGKIISVGLPEENQLKRILVESSK